MRWPRCLVSKQEIPKPEQDPGCQEANGEGCCLDFRVWSDFLSPGRGSWWWENGFKMHALSGGDRKSGSSVRVAAGSAPGKCGTTFTPVLRGWESGEEGQDYKGGLNILHLRYAFILFSRMSWLSASLLTGHSSQNATPCFSFLNPDDIGFSNELDKAVDTLT